MITKAKYISTIQQYFAEVFFFSKKKNTYLLEHQKWPKTVFQGVKIYFCPGALTLSSMQTPK